MFAPHHCINCGHLLEWRTVRGDSGSISEATCSRCGHEFSESVDVIEYDCSCTCAIGGWASYNNGTWQDEDLPRS